MSTQTSTQTTRAAIYARISIKEPNTPKVANQIEDCERLAQARGFEVVDTFVDDGISASGGKNRPGFEDLLAAVAAKRFSVILATEQSRFDRNKDDRDRLELACLLAGVTWTTLRQGDIDPASSEGEFMSTLHMALSRREVRIKADRQKSSNAAKRAQGVATPGQRPFGWEIVGAKPITFVPVLPEQALIWRGIQLILHAGAKPWGVAKDWNQSGITTGRGNTWTTTSVVSVLRRWRNAGFTEHADEPIAKAAWEAICTREELEEVRVILDKRGERSAGWRAPVGLCSGIARCVCGATMVRTGIKDKPHYRCSTLLRPQPGSTGTVHVQIPAAQLDAQARDAVARLYALAPEASAQPDAEAIELSELHRERVEVTARIGRINDLYVDGEITKAERTKRVASHQARLDQIQAAVDARVRQSAHVHMLVQAQQRLLATPPGGSQSFAGDYEALVTQLGEKFDELSLEDRRGLLAATHTITVQPGRDPHRVWIDTIN